MYYSDGTSERFLPLQTGKDLNWAESDRPDAVCMMKFAKPLVASALTKQATSSSAVTSIESPIVIIEFKAACKGTYNIKSKFLTFRLLEEGQEEW